MKKCNIREQGSGNRDQGTGIREKGTGNSEAKTKTKIGNWELGAVVYNLKLAYKLFAIFR